MPLRVSRTELAARLGQRLPVVAGVAPGPHRAARVYERDLEPIAGGAWGLKPREDQRTT